MATSSPSVPAMAASGMKKQPWRLHATLVRQWSKHGNVVLAIAAALGWGLYLRERRRREQAAASRDATAASAQE